jgi:hypothetical protein
MKVINTININNLHYTIKPIKIQPRVNNIKQEVFTMKKLVASLLVLSLAVAGVFAEIYWGGEVLTGVYSRGDGFLFGEEEDATIGYRLKLGGAVVGKNWGAQFGFQAGGSADDMYDAGIFSMSVIGAHGGTLPIYGGIYAWWQPLSFLKLNLGAMDNKVWRTPGAYDEGEDDVTGMRVEFIPVKGLNIGFAYGLPNFGSTRWFDSFTFGAKYTTDALSAIAAYKFGYINSSNDDFEHIILYGIGYTFPFGLTAVVDGGVVLSKNAGRDTYEVAIDEKLAYALLGGKLGLELVVKETIKSGYAVLSPTTPYNTFDIDINPAVWYAILDNLKVGLAAELGIRTGDTKLASQSVTVANVLKPTEVTYFLGWDEPFVGFIKPYIEVKPASSITFTLYDKIYFNHQDTGKSGVVNGFGASVRVTL